MTQKILISTGGSGGHVVPATILYEHLKNKYPKMQFDSRDDIGDWLKYQEVN